MEVEFTSGEKWEMVLFTFPYWFIIDKEDLNRVVTINVKGSILRFYVPYKSSPANEQFSPQPENALFSDGLMKPINPKYPIPKVSIYPLFNENGIGIKEFQAELNKGWNANRRTIKDMPVDTLRIDAQLKGNTSLGRDLLVLMQIIRVKSRQWWIGNAYNTSGSIQVVQPIDSNGNCTTEPPRIRTPYVFVSGFSEQIIDFDMWVSSLQDLAESRLAPLHKVALMDEMYYYSISDTRRCVLDIARALDVATDTLFKKIWSKDGMGTAGNYSRKAFIKGKRVPPKKDKGYNGATETPLMLSHVTNHFLHKSFEKDYYDEFIVINNFWENKRNPVSHGVEITVKHNELSVCINAAEKCIDWIENL